MLDLPYYISLTFILTTLATFVFFLFSMFLSSSEVIRRRANFISLVILLWIVFQSTLALNGWYMDRVSIPPHIVFPVVTFTVVALFLFTSERGKKFIDSLSMQTLTWVHLVRIPVELCLLWLAQNKQVPYSMTFEGYNFDIVFGITAPLVALLYFRWKKISNRVFLIWNVLGIISVLAIVVRAAGAAPTALQAWDFAQPNYAILHFPVIWLPSFIVPIVLIAHFKAVRQLRRMG